VDKNLALVEALRAIGATKGATPGQLAIAWVRARGDDVVPIVGARRRDQLKEALGAMDLCLDAGDLARIEAAVPPEKIAGARYDPTQMAHLDSERRG
jgi:aryl-alcohol dehydrogenase-like predicted oxidoreductase